MIRDAVSAEWTKLRTAPGTAWLLLAVAVLTMAVGTVAAATVRCRYGGCPVDPVKVSLTGIELGQAVVAILGILAIGGEYSTGMIRVSLAAVPHRGAVLVAKAAVLTGVVALAAIPGVLGSLLAGRLILPGHGFTAAHGYPALSPANGAVLRAVVGSVLYLVLIALLGLGTAAAVRDSPSATGVVLGLLYLLPILTQVVSEPSWRRHLQQIAPMSAGLAIQATTELDKLPIGPWPGLGVLACWAAGALLAGGVLLRVRDA